MRKVKEKKGKNVILVPTAFLIGLFLQISIYMNCMMPQIRKAINLWLLLKGNFYAIFEKSHFLQQYHGVCKIVLKLTQDVFNVLELQVHILRDCNIYSAIKTF